ncbi:MAG: hypothetical protein K9K67_08940 [Bacteriovoracaceae bacterium]|nr:hypothetical protein [Bacteriovoracaceae bacterium]
MRLICVYFLTGLLLLISCHKESLIKDHSQMNVEKIEITSLFCKSSDNGSMSPNSPNYHSEWNYTPNHEESELLLDETLVNNKATLRQYFIALGAEDSQFLEELKFKESPAKEGVNLSKQVESSTGKTGGRTSSWSIHAKLNGDKIVSISNRSIGFAISQFPYTLVRSKGVNKTSSKDRRSVRPPISRSHIEEPSFKTRQRPGAQKEEPKKD